MNDLRAWSLIVGGLVALSGCAAPAGTSSGSTSSETIQPARTLVVMSLLSGVTARDPRTVVLHWKQTYPNADGGGNSNVFNPLPRHILAQPFQTLEPEAFVGQPFFTREYIGTGPYKLDRWEPGSYLEGAAFDGDVFGKPGIPRIRLVFIGDPNTALANVLAGEAQLTSGDPIRFTDGETLRQQWGERGSIINTPNQGRITQLQYRPELASTQAFTDLRVRQALAYGIDFPSVNEVVQGGRAKQAFGPVPPVAAYYGELEKVVTKYLYDPRKSAQIMLDAGFTKGPDGVFVHPNPAWGRMSFETNVLANPDSENEMHIMAGAWRNIGFDIREVVWAASIGADNETRTNFPGLSTTTGDFGETGLTPYRRDRIPTAERRWQGGNRGAWPGLAEYDRLIEVYETTLDRSARTDAVLQMSKLYTENLPALSLYFKLNAIAVARGLTGPRVTDPNGTAEWNIHEWDHR